MKRLHLFGFVLCVGVFASAFFVNSSASSLSFQDSVDVQFTFNPSLTITVSGDLVIDNLAPGSSSDSNIIDVNVATNNITGYVLTATTGNTTHTTTELTQPNVTNKFTSLATNADISSITTDNTWGYSFSNDNGTNWTNYSGLPLYTAESGKELVNTNTNASIPIKFKIGAKASSTQPSGTYTNVINFIAVANPEPQLGPVACTPGYICYQTNALTGVQGTMADQSATDNNTVTLYASNFSRSGYGFAGWSDVYDYDTNQNAHFYGPQEDITVPTGTTANGTSLYAVWIKSAGSMQSSTKVSQVCNSLTQAPTNGTANLSSVSALTDQRDNQTYAIAKLADGNCWMIENLRLENTAEHNSDGTLAQGYDSSFVGLANPESTYFSGSTTANSLYSIDGSTTSTISGDNQGYRFPRYNNFNTQQRAENTSNTNVNTYSYGNYYTYAAAIADTTDYTSNDDHGITSICPTGWRIPVGSRQTTATNSFGALSVALGGPANGAESGPSSTPTGAVMSTRFRSFPNNFVYSGSFDESSARDRGSVGFYWSSTSNHEGNSFRLYLNQSYALQWTNVYNKRFGHSIRCTVNAMPAS